MSPPVPPPLASPKPPDPGEEETVTGVFPASRAYVRHVGWLTTMKTAGLLVLTIAGATLTAYKTFTHEARAQADAGVRSALAPIVADIGDVKRRQTSVEEQQRAVLTELRETRQDFRELYKSQRYDKPSPRLEKPLPALDGGQ